jgi:hypothetical protein
VRYLECDISRLSRLLLRASTIELFLILQMSILFQDVSLRSRLRLNRQGASLLLALGGDWHRLVICRCELACTNGG